MIIRTRILTLALTLLLPLSFTQKTRALSRGESIALAIVVTALVAVPVGLAIVYYREQKRLTNRTDSEVLTEAQSYAHTIEIDYKSAIDLAQQITPEIKDRERKGIEQDVLAKATASSSARYPLINYVDNLTDISRKLKDHEGWLNERVTRTQATPNPNIHFIDQATTHRALLRKLMEHVAQIKDIVATSHSYTHEKLMKQADDTRPMYQPIYVYR